MSTRSRANHGKKGLIRHRTGRVAIAVTALAQCALLTGFAGPPRSATELRAAAGTAASGAPSPQSGVTTPREGDATVANYKFRDGETIDQLKLHYTLLGEPHKNQKGVVDNAILLLHWTGASSKALLTPEFQQSLFTPGAPFDVTRYLVIIPDAIGHGQSSKPSDGLRSRFPHYGYGDMVDLQHKLVTETLGISHLRAVVGMSMGCMNAWQWAEAYPSAMDGIMPVACFPAPISGRNLLWRKIIVDQIKSDPTWNGGNYQQQPPAAAAAASIARMMIDGVSHLQEEVTTPGQADKFIQAVKAQSSGGDANDLIYSLEASQDFNGEPHLGNITAKVYAVNFADDEFYRDSLGILQRGMTKVQHGRYVVRPTTDDSAGHLSMTHPALWKDKAQTFTKWLNAN